MGLKATRNQFNLDFKGGSWGLQWQSCIVAAGGVTQDWSLMPNLFPQLLAAVFSCIFPWDFLLPPPAAGHYWSLTPQPSDVSPGLLKHVMCSRNVRLVPSPVISHSPSRGAAAPLELGWRAHVLQAPSVHLINDSLSLKSTFKSRIFYWFLCAKGTCNSRPFRRKSHTKYQFLLRISRRLLLISPVSVSVRGWDVVVIRVRGQTQLSKPWGKGDGHQSGSARTSCNPWATRCASKL